MEELVICTGVMGVGKGTVIKQALGDSDYKYVNFGDIIEGLLLADNKIETRDDIRNKLDQETWVLYQKKTAEKISAMLGKILLDTHITFASPYGYFPGLPKWVLENFNPLPKAIIVIEGSSKDVKKRRQADDSRIRGFSYEQDIEAHQKTNRFYAASYSTITGARIVFLENKDGELDKAVTKFKKILKEL